MKKKQAAALQARKVSLPTTVMSHLSRSANEPSGSNLFKKRRVDDSPIRKAFDMQNRDQLDALIARMFYTGGLPFILCRNPYYVDALTFASNHPIGGYVPPSYTKLRTTLLHHEKIHVERLLEPIKSTWGEKETFD